MTLITGLCIQSLGALGFQTGIPAWPNVYPMTSDSQNAPTAEELEYMAALSSFAENEGLPPDQFIEETSSRVQYVFNHWNEARKSKTTVPPTEHSTPISATVPTHAASSSHESPVGDALPASPPATSHTRTALDIISQGMGLTGKGENEVKGILKQQDEAKETRQRKKQAAVEKGKAKCFHPFTQKHRRAVLDLVNGLRRQLADYARKHQLNLTEVGALLNIYLQTREFTSWQAFLSVRACARQGCKTLPLVFF